MTDTKKLNAIINESGMTITAIANKLSISREGLYHKIQGKTEFKASEIVKMAEILHIDKKTRDSIFLHRG